MHLATRVVHDADDDLDASGFEVERVRARGERGNGQEGAGLRQTAEVIRPANSETSTGDGGGGKGDASTKLAHASHST